MDNFIGTYPMKEDPFIGRRGRSGNQKIFRHYQCKNTGKLIRKASNLAPGNKVKVPGLGIQGRQLHCDSETKLLEGRRNSLQR